MRRDSTRPISHPALVSLPDAADFLQVSVPSLRRWLREGQLGCVRCGRAVRIEREELARFIAQNRRPARKA